MAVRYFRNSSPAVIAECWTSWGAIRALERDRASGQYAPATLYQWHLAYRDGPRPRVRLPRSADAVRLPRSGEVSER